MKILQKGTKGFAAILPTFALITFGATLASTQIANAQVPSKPVPVDDTELPVFGTDSFVGGIPMQLLLLTTPPLVLVL